MSFGAIRQTSPNSGYLQEQRPVRKIIDPMRHVHARVCAMFTHASACFLYRSAGDIAISRPHRRQRVVSTFVPILSSSTMRDMGTRAAGSSLEPTDRLT
jgi:hypothetical protein